MNDQFYLFSFNQGCIEGRILRIRRGRIFDKFYILHSTNIRGFDEYSTFFILFYLIQD